MVKTQKMQVLGEVSSRVSHDLRNPLNVIKNSIDIMNMRWKDEMNQEMTEYLTKMSRAIRSINSIIEDIVNFARTRSLILENNSLLSTINRAIELIYVPQNIEIRVPQKDISFEFDSTKLEVLFTNLITNSVHAIGDKNGEILIQFDEKDHDIVQMKVQDSGPGIPEGLLPRIFEPLFTTKQYGTGLGLPSCKDIIEQHNGTISISNSPTVVTIVMPKHHNPISEIDHKINQ